MTKGLVAVLFSFFLVTPPISYAAAYQDCLSTPILTRNSLLDFLAPFRYQDSGLKYTKKEFLFTAERFISTLAEQRKEGALPKKIGKKPKKKYYIDGEVVSLPKDIKSIFVIGDIHGDYSTLQTNLLLISYYLQTQTRNWHIVFLGDYVNKGNRNLDVLYLLFQLKIVFPNNITMLAGNHEENWQQFNHSSSLSKEIQKRFKKTKKIRSKINTAFHSLPSFAFSQNGFDFYHAAPPTADVIKETNIKKGGLQALSHRKNREAFVHGYLIRKDLKKDIKYKGKNVPGQKSHDRFHRYTGARVSARGHDPRFPPYQTKFKRQVVTVISTDYKSPDYEHGPVKAIGRFLLLDGQKEYTELDLKKLVVLTRNPLKNKKMKKKILPFLEQPFITHSLLKAA